MLVIKSITEHMAVIDSTSSMLISAEHITPTFLDPGTKVEIRLLYINDLGVRLRRQLYKVIPIKLIQFY